MGISIGNHMDSNAIIPKIAQESRWLQTTYVNDSKKKGEERRGEKSLKKKVHQESIEPLHSNSWQLIALPPNYLSLPKYFSCGFFKTHSNSGHAQ